ncbi:MAG: hypothetical protein JNM43_04665 [Planctomycetaceae bacterium]|nr:hypothetical protein [Planctomycetaceae bacterium]
MRFRSKGQPRDKQFARAQKRLTLGLAGVVVLLLVYRIAYTGGLWTSSAPASTAAAKPTVPSSLLGQSEMQPDEFQVVPSTDATSPSDYAKMIDRAGAAAMEREPIAVAGSDDVPEKLTRQIKDDVIGVQGSEAEAWFGTLVLAEKVLPYGLKKFPEGQYALFMASPEACRGKPFVIRGRLRRLLKAPLPRAAETFGVKSAYDAWISTKDSGSSLIHVNALSADPGLPLRELNTEESIEIELAGYFFKREGYAARGRSGEGDLAHAPLLISDRIRILPPRTVSTRADDLNPWLGWFGAVLTIGVLAILWRFHASDDVFRNTKVHQMTSLPVRPSFDGVDSISMKEILQGMEEQARATSTEVSMLTELHTEPKA